MTEPAKAGLLVLISTVILLIVVFYMTNIGFGTRYETYKMYLSFAGGLESGSPVRFGGLKVGRVKDLRVFSKDPSRIEIDLEVRHGTPVHTDSVASLAQLGLLGENYVEIQPGKTQTPLAPGSTIPSAETQDLAALMRRMNVLAEQAQPLIADLHKNLNQVSAQIDVVLTNVRDLTGETNRANLEGILRNSNEMIAKTSPRLDAIGANLQTASTKLDPLMTDLRATTAKLDKLIAEVNGMVGENRKEIREAVLKLSTTLESTRAMIAQLNTTLTDNSQNMDNIFQNMRATSENLSELSDTLKQRPFSLLRVIPKPERQVPGASGGKAAAGKNHGGGK